MKGRKVIVRSAWAAFSVLLTIFLVAVPLKVVSEFKRVFTLKSGDPAVVITAEQGGNSPAEESDTLSASEPAAEPTTVPTTEPTTVLTTAPTTVPTTVPVTEATTEKKKDFSVSDDEFPKEIEKIKNYDGVNWAADGIQYLSDVQDVPEYKKILLKVPSYKQTDIRWRYRRIGWGSTLGSVGCATTALAMAESFHLGKTVTPSDMASRLSYTGSARLYWPSEYKEEKIRGTDYIPRIYKMLSKGKPVVLGMRKYSGAEHWVVITGHTKYAYELKKENFRINDPGSKTRKTLKDFISEYPVPYKMVYRK